jgi:hypothetical protein
MKVQVGSWKFKQVGIDFEELPKWYKVELCVRRILHWWVIEWIFFMIDDNVHVLNMAWYFDK